MRPVEALTTAQLTEENKALMRKKKEISDRQGVIAAEVGRRAKRSRAEHRLFGLSEEEIELLDSAIERKRARREIAKLEAQQ